MFDKDPLVPSTCDSVATGSGLYLSLQGHFCGLLHSLGRSTRKAWCAFAHLIWSLLQWSVSPKDDDLCCLGRGCSTTQWARLLCPAADSIRQNHVPLSPQEAACLCSLPSAHPSLAPYKYVTHSSRVGTSAGSQQGHKHRGSLQRMATLMGTHGTPPISVGQGRSLPRSGTVFHSVAHCTLKHGCTRVSQESDSSH